MEIIMKVVTFCGGAGFMFLLAWLFTKYISKYRKDILWFILGGKFKL